MKHLLTTKDLSREDAIRILDTAAQMAATQEREIRKLPTLRGKTVVNLFFEDSTRTRISFEAAAKRIQDLYLDGRKAEATAAVPDELADEVALVGPPARIRDRLAPWRESGVTTMICGLRQREVLRTLAEAG